VLVETLVADGAVVVWALIDSADMGAVASQAWVVQFENTDLVLPEANAAVVLPLQRELLPVDRYHLSVTDAAPIPPELRQVEQQSVLHPLHPVLTLQVDQPQAPLVFRSYQFALMGFQQPQC